MQEFGVDAFLLSAFVYLFDGSVERLAVNLTDTLGTSHDVGGVDGLVGGYHHELLGAVLDGEVGDDACAVDVVLHGHGGIVLHHGHMLVCCGVEDVVGLVATEDVLHECLVGDACYDGVAEDVGELGSHDATHVMHGCLGLVDEYHLLGLEACHLVHHLASDAACSTCDEHTIGLQLLSDGLHVHFDFLSWQQVFDVHLMEQAGAQLALAVPFLFGVGHHHDFDAGRDEAIDDGILFAEVCYLQRADYQG